MSKAATPEQFNHLACQIATVTVTKRYENVFGQGECCLLLQYSFKCQVYFRYALGISRGTLFCLLLSW